MSDKIIVAYVCDSRYRPWLFRSINSVRRYNKNVEIAILSDQKFEMEGAKVYTIHPNTDIFKHRVNDRMGDGVYYKLYLPELPYKKIIYLDCDTICQRPLNELWDMPCEFINATESHDYGKVQAQLLGVNRYYLSGMMVMNLEALRAVNFTDKCLSLMKTMVRVKWHDETLINKLFNNRIRSIDKKFNYCRDRIYDDPIPESDAYILHYVGRRNKVFMLRLDEFRQLHGLFEKLKDKRVAIVGNATSLLGKGQSEEIDAHDIVIRFNKGFPSKDVGLNTDIVFLACTLTAEELHMYRKYNYTCAFVKRSKLCGNACEYDLHSTDRTRYAQVPCAYRAKTSPGKLSQASTGFLAIQFALSTECKSIDLYGFDFFKTDTYYNPLGYQTLHNGNKEAEKVLEYEKYGLLKIR